MPLRSRCYIKHMKQSKRVFMIKKIFAAVFIFISCTVSAELFFRVYLPLPVQVSMVESENRGGNCFEASFAAGYTPVANRCGRDGNGLLRSKGRTSGILVLGDSLSDRDGWAQLIEEKYPDRIINGAVSGYGTCQELHWFRVIDQRIQVEGLILQMCPNDLGGSASLVPLENGNIRYFWGEEGFDVPNWIFSSHLLTYAMLHYGIRNTAVPASNAKQQYQYTKQCLIELQKEVGKRPFSILIFPVLSDSPKEHPKGWQDEVELENIVEETGINYISLRKSLPNTQFQLLRERKQDHVHPSMKGSQKFMTTILPFLQHQSQFSLEE